MYLEFFFKCVSLHKIMDPLFCFCQNSLDQIILEIPSTLVFYDSMNPSKLILLSGIYLLICRSHIISAVSAI